MPTYFFLRPGVLHTVLFLAGCLWHYFYIRVGLCSSFSKEWAQILHNSMALAERDQNPLWGLLSGLETHPATPKRGDFCNQVSLSSLGHLLSYTAPQSCLVSTHCKMFLLGGRSSHCLCQGSSFVSWSAGGKSPSDNDSFLYLPPRTPSSSPLLSNV